MSKRSAFTLVELLVVIAIIALLMSILMPALAKVKKQAKAAACMAHLSQWGKFFAMYTNQNDGYFMGGFSNDPSEHWTSSLRSYYQEQGGITCCPSAMKKPKEYKLTGSTFECWGLLHDYNGYIDGDYGSYGINAQVFNRPLPNDNDPDDNLWRRPDAKGAGRVPVFLDSLWTTGYTTPFDEPPEYDGAPWAPSTGGGTGGNMGIFCINRHSQFINVLFMDWSVRKVGLKQLWLLKWGRHFDTNGPWTPGGNVTKDDWESHGSGWMGKLKDFSDAY